MEKAPVPAILEAEGHLVTSVYQRMPRTQPRLLPLPFTTIIGSLPAMQDVTSLEANLQEVYYLLHPSTNFSSTVRLL